MHQAAVPTFSETSLLFIIGGVRRRLRDHRQAPGNSRIPAICNSAYWIPLDQQNMQSEFPFMKPNGKETRSPYQSSAEWDWPRNSSGRRTITPLQLPLNQSVDTVNISQCLLVINQDAQKICCKLM
jgi:hypothetical protein